MTRALAEFKAVFDRPGPRLVLGQPVAMPTRYRRDDRDTAVFNAQNDAIAVVPHRMLDGAAEIQAYVDEVLAMPWPRWHTGPAWAVVVRVVPGLTASNGTAAYRSGVMFVPGRIEELIVLHELAHHLVPSVTDPHGASFVAVYLDLIEHVINPAASNVFTECLAAEGISA